MSKKVYEIARELEMDSKELLEKINAMGIEAKSHNSVISDIDVKAITNMILHSRTKTTETKIVKAPPKSTTEPKGKEVKVAVKPATVAAKVLRQKAEQKAKAEARAAQRTIDSARDAMQAKASAAIQPPTGVPLPKSASVQTPVGVPLPKSASVQAPVGVPLPKSASVQDIKEKEELAKTETEAKMAEPVNEEKAAPKKETVKEPVQEEAPKTEEKPAVPKRVVIKKKAAEIEAEKAAKEKAAKEAEEKAAKEKAAKEKAAKEVTAKPAKGKTAKQTAGAKAEKKVAAKAEKADTEKTAVPSEDIVPPKSDKTAERHTRQKKSSIIDDEPVGKKERDKKLRGKVDKEKPGKRDYKKADDWQTLSMEKPTPKKSKKKAEKQVEPESTIDLEALTPGTKVINVPITVKGLSEQIDKSVSEIIMALMKLGIMANINQNLDEDTVILVGAELGVNIVVDKVEEETVEEGIETFEDKPSDLVSRPPIITVMGHVDHGKTSLLDAIRNTNVTSTESGGITQHIGASEVTVNGQRIVFLDTPGHEAFTAMRARGAHVTDIAILVVAADDSVKPQTIESISHAKAAGVSIIVAINKVDKPEADPDRVKQDLAGLPADQRVLVEEWGGDTICVPVSAKTGDGIHNLLEMILLQAEVMELKANPNRLAMGTVLEARLDKSKGPVATLLVLNGTLETGMPVVAGICSGKVRAMTNFKGERINKAGPATAVEIIGLDDVPEAGDQFHAVREDRVAREIAEQRRLKLREEVMVKTSRTTLEQLFSQIKEGEVKELNLIIKADVQGSVGALISSLERLHTENVRVKIIHSGVGTITESDVMLASTSDAVIIGFNVRPSSTVTAMAEREDVEIRTYRVIYDVIDDVEAAIKGMLDPEYKEVILGKVEIRNTFKVPGVGIVGGAYVLEGKIQRNAEIRLIRDGIVIHEGKIFSLKRYKDDVREVNQGYECGIGIENYNDIKEGDIIEAFKMEEIAR